MIVRLFIVVPVTVTGLRVTVTGLAGHCDRVGALKVGRARRQPGRLDRVHRPTRSV